MAREGFTLEQAETEIAAIRGDHDILGEAHTFTDATDVPVTPAGGSVLYSQNGNAQAINDAGWAGSLPVIATDISSTTVTAATSSNLSAVFNIPANDANVGTCYRITCGGNGTQASGTTRDLTFGFYVAGSPVGANVKIAGASAATWGVSETFRWAVTAEITAVTLGVTGTLFGSMLGALSNTTAASVGAAGATLGFADANANAFTWDTTGGRSFAIKCNWGSTTGAPTITCTHTIFERLGP